MKKILLFTFLTVAILFGRQNVNAQITVDHVYTADLPFAAVKLSSGLKYCAEHSVIISSFPVIQSVTYFVLYNPDHSVYRTINIPQISGKYDGQVSFISDALFNLDTLIEYMLYYTDITTYVQSAAILNESGNTVLYVDSVNFSGGSYQSFGFIGSPIFPDGNQTKLYIITNYPPAATSTTTVYNLPGRLACLECDSGFVGGNAQPQGFSSEHPVLYQLKAFPNPNDGNATIEFKLPQGKNSGEIVLYNMDGSEVKRYRVDGAFGNLILNNSGLKSGTYMYQLIAGNVAVDSKRMIIIR